MSVSLPPFQLAQPQALIHHYLMKIIVLRNQIGSSTKVLPKARTAGLSGAAATQQKRLLDIITSKRVTSSCASMRLQPWISIRRRLITLRGLQAQLYAFDPDPLALESIANGKDQDGMYFQKKVRQEVVSASLQRQRIPKAYAFLLRST